MAIPWYLSQGQWADLRRLFRYCHTGRILSRADLLGACAAYYVRHIPQFSSWKRSVQRAKIRRLFSSATGEAVSAVENEAVRTPTVFDRILFSTLWGFNQSVIYQSYQACEMVNLSSVAPLLDVRLIKYANVSDRVRFGGPLNKQFARDAMADIMDPEVIQRRDNQGLRWRSTRFLASNHKKIASTILDSRLLAEMLSPRTRRQLESRIFSKRLMLALFSVALFDEAFHPTLSDP